MGMTTEGIQYFMQQLAQEVSLPTEYYLGWATNTSLLVSSTMLSITELSGNGYARQLVSPGSSAFELVTAAGGVNGFKMTTDTKTWTASGGDWALALMLFLTTTLTGTSGPLIGFQTLNEGSGVTLLNGQSYDAAMIILSEPSL